jgi:tetratricopeptide (TPR) repeat protein
MSFWIRFLFVAWLGVTLSGCEPGQDQLDEKKEPHYVLGESRVNAMDYQGAVEAFEESLEANPRSAAAHFELACLFDEKISDPAAAIYHYQEFLKLEPNADNAEVVRQRINSCKQQLAADVMAMPSAPATQAQLEKLAEQNRELQDEVDKWRAYYASQSKTNLQQNNSAAPSANANSVSQPQMISTQTQSVNANHPENAARTHAVERGETEAAIARKFGVKLSALQAANPGVNPNKLRVGQILSIPQP